MSEEIEKKRACAGEREAFARLVLMSHIADEIREDLDRRSKTVPGVRRDIGLLSSLPMRIYIKLIETIPAEQVGTLEKNANSTSYTIGSKALIATRSDEFGVWLSHKELGIILEALSDHCMMCTKESRQEYSSCPLKKALDIIGTDVDHSHGCGYGLF